MSVPQELQALISDLHKFLTGPLAQEVLSEDSEDKRDDLSSRLAKYLLTSQSTKSLPRVLIQPTAASDSILRINRPISTASPELPRAPPPGEVKKMSPKDLSNSTLNEGIIEKLGGKNQEKWQKRYCVLTHTYLYFFENAKSKKQNNQIYIPAFSVTPVRERGDEKHYCFKLSSKEAKSYYFRVNDSEVFNSWMHNLSQFCSNLHSLSVGGPIPRAETMVFNQDDVISSASSSDEADADSNLLDTIKEDPDPPPIPPPASGIPRSPQVLRKISPVPVPSVQTPPPTSTLPQTLSAAPPPPSSGKLSVDLPPPPTRSGSVLESGPGLSVKQLRQIKHSQLKSLSEARDNSLEAEEVQVDTGKVYETSEEEDFPYDKIYVAKWDFIGGEGDELSFKRGELLLVADPTESSEWWIGDLLHATTLKARDLSGLFYSAYAEPAFIKV